MVQISKRKLAPKIEKAIFDLLFQTLQQLKDKKLATAFLNDFFTPTEKIVFAKRLAIAYLLSQGLTIDQTAEILKTSRTTVSKVNIWLHYGGEGYQRLIQAVAQKRRWKNIFTDFLKSVYYGSPLPPKANWRSWFQAKRQWQKDQENPLH